MSGAFPFVDELGPAGDKLIRVLARVQVLATADGGRSGPFTARYRPNHNFGGAENRHFFIGQVEVPEGEWVHPGETRELTITFLNVAGLREQLTPGKRWRIQEGSHLIATAELLSLLPAVQREP
jgi:elongation factor Tu